MQDPYPKSTPEPTTLTASSAPPLPNSTPTQNAAPQSQGQKTSGIDYQELIDLAAFNKYCKVADFRPADKAVFEWLFADLEELLKKIPSLALNNKVQGSYFSVERNAPHIISLTIKEEMVKETINENYSVVCPTKILEKYGKVSMTVNARFSTVIALLKGYLFKQHPNLLLGTGESRHDNKFFIFQQGLEKDPFDVAHITSVMGDGKPIHIYGARGKCSLLDATGLHG